LDIQGNTCVVHSDIVTTTAAGDRNTDVTDILHGCLIVDKAKAAASAARRNRMPAGTDHQLMELTLDSQSQLINALQRPAAFTHPATDLRHLQTHISHVLLAGDFAYKMKKPLNLGFLDFSTCARRRFYCEEELRLNRRLAPSLYLEVVPITGSPSQPGIGGSGPVLDYAIKMRRFAQTDLLDGQHLNSDLIDRLARCVADFHQRLTAAPADSDFGDAPSVWQPMQENFRQIHASLVDPQERIKLQPLQDWTRTRFEDLRPLLARRKSEGYIRECHGDMHLGNIALVADELVIFDGIEFNPGLRWIDTISEAAFLTMDIERAGYPELARRFINRYLELSGDYAALPLLDFYKVYRALVRAKVDAIRQTQPDLPTVERHQILDNYRRHIGLAQAYCAQRACALLITHGVSGAGKTQLSGYLVETLGVLRLRSDYERKRLFGLSETARSHSRLARGLYGKAATQRTYRRLRELVRLILQAGYPALVDATFLRQAQRQSFAQLAAELRQPFIILDLHAPLDELRRRVTQRQAVARDASEAGLEVLQRQWEEREPLNDCENARALRLDSAQALPLERLRRLMQTPAAAASAIE
jgi:aminoglycoside phosphotransferase family enzyme/predicted kinase